MNARLSSANDYHGPLTIEKAVAVLDAMRKEEVPCDLAVVERIEELFRALPDEYADADLVRALLNIENLLEQQLLFRRAVPITLKAMRWANRIGDRHLLAKAWTGRGTLASDSGDSSVAVEAYLEALRLYTALGYKKGMAICYYNIGGLMKRLGRDSAAIACARKCLELSKDLDAKEGAIRGAALSGLADVHLRQGDYREALRSALQAQVILSEADCAMSHVASAIQNEVCARVRLLDFEGAHTALNRLMKLAEAYPSGYAEGYVRFATAMYDGFLGKTAQAAATLRRDFAHWPERHQDALGCLIDIYEQAKEADNALDVARELLEHLRSAGRALTQADLDRIDVFTPDDSSSEIRELIERSARFETEIKHSGDKLQAKLAYLFELAVAAELREEDNAYAGEHIYRVGRLCAALAVDVGCGDEFCWLAEIAGRVHDVGKTSLPSQVVLKIEPLSQGERDILRAHAEDGSALVSQLNEPRLSPVISAVRHHHENWDGSGYPSGLNGAEIPLLARIVSLCDSFDAMTHSRPFRTARSVDDALQEIERCAGSRFDPDLARLLVNLVKRLQLERGDLDEYLGESGRRTRWAKSHPELLRLLGEQRAMF